MHVVRSCTISPCTRVRNILLYQYTHTITTGHVVKVVYYYTNIHTQYISKKYIAYTYLQSDVARQGHKETHT